MTFVLYFLTCLPTAIVGFFCGVVVADFSVKWLRIYGGQGNAAYFAFELALFGALIGLFVAIVTTALSSPQGLAGYAKSIGISCGILIVFTLIILGACRHFAHVAPTIDGQKLTLEVELRLPSGKAAPADRSKEANYIGLHAVKDGQSRKAFYGPIEVAQSRVEDNRVILPARVPIETSFGKRLLTATIGGKADVVKFEIPLPPHPTSAHLQWSAWLMEPQPSDATPENDKRIAYRFRAQKIKKRDVAAEAREREAKLIQNDANEVNAISADAPLTAYFEYTRLEHAEETRTLAIERMKARPRFVEELQNVMISDDANRAAEALRLIERWPDSTPELVRAVEATGRDIADRIRAVNATPENEDPDLDAAAGVATRFNAWIGAVAHLRGAGSEDFIPELRSIVELTQGGRHNDPIRHNIQKVAVDRLKNWTGAATLPADSDSN